MPFSGLSQLNLQLPRQYPQASWLWDLLLETTFGWGEKKAFSKSLCDSSFYRAGVELLQPQSLCVLVITGFYESRMFSHLLDALPGMQRWILHWAQQHPPATADVVFVQQ